MAFSTLAKRFMPFGLFETVVGAVLRCGQLQPCGLKDTVNGDSADLVLPGSIAFQIL